jgi:hypothetical protein
MFTPDDRARVAAQLRQAAEDDARIVAAAFVGSAATGGDRWSDIDLSLAVADDVPVDVVLADWTRTMESLGSRTLFDYPAGPTIYRVFLLPGALQVDLSFTPAASFAPTTARFTLLFGETVDRPASEPPDPAHAFGLGVHHAVRASISLERGRRWQAEYWLSGVRDETLAIACIRCGLPPAHARGVDELPPDLLQRFEGTFPASLDAGELRRALGLAIELLLLEGGDPALPLADDLRALQ